MTPFVCGLLPVIAGVVQADDVPAPRFEGAGIFILGEVHDNPAHHATQAAIVAELQPQAIVFEMLEPDAARRVTPENRMDAAHLEAVLEWTESGWPDFAMYHPIFTAAPDAAIFGAALPHDDVRRAVTDGAAAVLGDSAALFGLDQPLPEDQHEDRVDLQREAHCDALPETLLPGMVEAQRLRDAALARASVAAYHHAKALSDTPTVVVIAGNGHAREDWGVPALLNTYYADDPAAPDRHTLGQFEDETPGDAPFSNTTSAPAPEREDPCLAFAK